MRSKFDEQLELLNVELIRMGALCEEAITGAMRTLFEFDFMPAEDDEKKMAGGRKADAVKKVISLEEEIDQKERDIEALCLKLILQQQPVARDLRIISSALKMISDMERIGDQASDIAEISAYIEDSIVISRIHIKDMAQAAIRMVTESVDSFVNNDLELAHKVIEDDDIVDNYFNTIKKELITLIRDDVSYSEKVIDFLMIAKYLERIGDHAENIAEWVIYSINGEYN